MKKIINHVIIIAAMMLASINLANAQITFQKKYGGVSSETGYSVKQTFDGGYIMSKQSLTIFVDSAVI